MIHSQLRVMRDEDADLLASLAEVGRQEEEEERAMMLALEGMREDDDCATLRLDDAAARMTDRMEEEEEAMLRELGLSETSVPSASGAGQQKDAEAVMRDAHRFIAMLDAADSTGSTGVVDDAPPSNAYTDVELVRHRVVSLKKEAVLSKRAGNVDEARAKLREAKQLEAVLLKRAGHIDEARAKLRDAKIAQAQLERLDTVAPTQESSQPSISVPSADLAAADETDRAHDLADRVTLMLAEMSNQTARMDKQMEEALNDDGTTEDEDGEEEKEVDAQLLREFDEICEDVTGEEAAARGASEGSDASTISDADATEARRHRIVALKKEAVLSKRAGNIDEARAKLREAKQLEAALG